MPDLDVLARSLPEGCLLTDPDVIAAFSQDYSRYPIVGRPLAVVRATSAADVQETLRWAAAHGIPVVPRGAGSGLSGGATAVDGGIVLSLDRMRAIEVDADSRTAVAEPGAFNVDVKRAAATKGLWYPPDPSSFEMCSIGGNVATNAGGMCCVKYGVTTDYVLGLEVVLADGTLVRLGGPRLKDTAGLSLAKLFVGSEGTLGVVTEVTLRLLPSPPPAATLAASFPSVDEAVEAVLAILRLVRPSTLELMDNVTINAVEDLASMELDRSAGALLIARTDASRAGTGTGDAMAGTELGAMVAACAGNGATEVYHTADVEEGEAFLAARRAAIVALEKKGDLLLEDIGVPVPKLPALVRALGEVARAHDTTVALVAHAGDGNTHPTIIYDASDAAATARAQAAFSDIMERAIALGGTITGEHGVGRWKTPWLADYLGPEAMALTRRIKEALDPEGILNPGVMF
jgi:glycolate oxidase